MLKTNKVTLKSKLKKQQTTIGSWITLAHPAIAEIMANAGFDWLAVDLEHSAIGIREAVNLIRVIDLCGAAPLVRLSSNDSVQIKRVMDAGAHGVIVPMVNSAGDAEKAVDAVYYPPIGRRGVGLARAQGYGPGFAQYLNWLTHEAVVIVQIEHIEAANNLEGILAVEGVDGFIVGPYDLSASLGVAGQFDHPLMKKAMEQIEKIGGGSDKALGIHVVEPQPDELKTKIEQGYRFLAYSVDIRMLDYVCRSGLASVPL
jgi:2-keto-3-deoxy-L-rhamnonate aldolase RhmA